MADKPITREEKYLAYLTGDYKGGLPKPITRKERYLYELCLKGMGGEISPEEIKNAVNEYLEKNPVKPGATTEQAQQIEQNKTDVASLKEETGSLKEDLSAITDAETKTETHNIEQNVIKTINYYYWNGKPNTNTDYFYVHLDNLQEGDIITAIIDSAHQVMRFIDAYNGTDRVSSASISSDTELYTVPSGVDNLYITCLMRFVNNIQFYVKRTVTVSTITPKGFNNLNKKVDAISKKTR
nr:MAG TPA_asm: hypothetical protein [Caudoviricetes sp.]